jgi:hypothetical protein
MVTTIRVIKSHLVRSMAIEVTTRAVVNMGMGRIMGKVIPDAVNP